MKGFRIVVSAVLLLFALLWVSTEVRANEGSKWNPMRYLPFSAPQEEDKAAPQLPQLTMEPADTLFVYAENTGALIETEKGNIAIELYPDQAPLTVENFLKLVDKRFYHASGMKFHRVVPGFVIQTGDPTGTGMGGSPDRIPLEVKNKLSHKAKGVVAMARGMDPNSATSQFYITLAPQKNLDGKYAVFGRVISGMDVLDRIKEGDMLYGVRIIDTSTVSPDPKEDRKGLGDSLKGMWGGKS
jgi:cyclophilin family peptidyl-prolyl cis-trans isomerase